MHGRSKGSHAEKQLSRTTGSEPRKSNPAGVRFSSLGGTEDRWHDLARAFHIDASERAAASTGNVPLYALIVTEAILHVTDA